MSVENEIQNYIGAQPERKAKDLQQLHELICALKSDLRLWYLDGKDEKGKVVSNPNIGYGEQSLDYANGSNRDFYRVGLSANSTGISVYIIGLSDKNYLLRTYGKTIGKASVTGYCIKFRSVQDIDLAVLTEAIHDGLFMARAKE